MIMSGFAFNDFEYLTLARQTTCTNKHINGAFTLHPTHKH